LAQPLGLFPRIPCVRSTRKVPPASPHRQACCGYSGPLVLSLSFFIPEEIRVLGRPSQALFPALPILTFLTFFAMTRQVSLIFYSLAAFLWAGPYLQILLPWPFRRERGIVGSPCLAAPSLQKFAAFSPLRARFCWRASFRCTFHVSTIFPPLCVFWAHPTDNLSQELLFLLSLFPPHVSGCFPCSRPSTVT